VGLRGCNGEQLLPRLDAGRAVRCGFSKAHPPCHPYGGGSQNAGLQLPDLQSQPARCQP